MSTLLVQELARHAERDKIRFQGAKEFSPKLELTRREHGQLQHLAEANGWSKSLAAEKVLRSMLWRLREGDIMEGMPWKEKTLRAFGAK